jgi:hypothetical protein
MNGKPSAVVAAAALAVVFRNLRRVLPPRERAICFAHGLLPVLIWP